MSSKKHDRLNLNIKSNGIIHYNNKQYHKNQYIKENPLYDPNINLNYHTSKRNFKIKPKQERKSITELYAKNDEGQYIDEYNIIPKRINAINQSQKEANYNYKSHEKIALNKKLYIDVMKFFFKRLLYYLITKGQEIVLPYVKLGSLQVCQKETTKYDHTSKTVNYSDNTKRIKYVDFAKSKKEGKTVYSYSPFWTKGYKPNLYHFTKKTSPNNISKKIDFTKDSSYYSWSLVRSARRPNKYNKTKPEVTLIDFFNKEGYKFYRKLK